MAKWFYAVLVLLLIALAFFSFQLLKKSNIGIVSDVFGKGELTEYVSGKAEEDIIKQRQFTYSILIKNLAKGQASNTKFNTIDMNSEVCQTANQITKGKTITKDKAYEIYKYINKNIKYDYGNIISDASGRPKIKAKKTPKETFEAGKGLCGEQAELFMYMMQCTGANSYKAFGGAHAWNTILEASDTGSAIEIDATQDCFDCTLENPISGICNANKCIELEMIS